MLAALMGPRKFRTSAVTGPSTGLRPFLTITYFQSLGFLPTRPRKLCTVLFRLFADVCGTKGQRLRIATSFFITLC
jgi:hypothetical protein